MDVYRKDPHFLNDMHDQQTALSYLDALLFGFSYVGEGGCGVASEFLKL